MIFPSPLLSNKILTTVYEDNIILCLKFYKSALEKSFLTTNFQITKFLLLTIVQDIKFTS